MNTHRLNLATLTTLCTLTGALMLSSTTLLALPTLAHAEECPNAALRVGPSSHLPDCRAYELVSPPFDAEGKLFQSSFLYDSEGTSGEITIGAAFAGSESFTDVNPRGPEAQYSLRRTAAGWTVAPDDPPASEFVPFLEEGFESYRGADQDGQTALWLDDKIGQPENRIDLIERLPDGSFAEVGPATPPTVPPAEGERGLGELQGLGDESGLNSYGASAEGSETFFKLNSEHRDEYWPFDETYAGDVSLYEYVGLGNTTPLLVGVSDGGTVVAGKTLPAGELISRCGILLGSGSTAAGEAAAGYGYGSLPSYPVSRNGETVFFTAEACAGGPPVTEVFARIDNGQSGARTVAISEPSKEDCSACDTEAGVLAGARFAGASADGSKVFFTTAQPLLGSDTSTNLYEYDFDAPAGERIIRVSGEDSTVSNAAAEVELQPYSPVELPVAKVSEDGSHVYFLANGVLTKTPNGEGESAEAGAHNLYVFERDGAYPAGRIAFVARLGPPNHESSEGETVEGRSFSDANVTPDGRFLVFASKRELTPDDTSAGLRQVFEYDAQTGASVRVSVGQEGFNHDGNVPPIFTMEGNAVNGAGIPAPSLGQRAVSEDGSYVFFESTVGLTPQALDQVVIGHLNEQIPAEKNHEPIYANNVYEYHDGRVSLISDGQDLTDNGSGSNVQLVGTDASGGDVFFSSADVLASEDSSSNRQLYDARVDGGFPTPVVPMCSGEDCQGALSAAPTLLSPGSEFQAGSNPPLAGGSVVKPAVAKSKESSKPAKCKRDRVRKKGKCVAVKTRAKKAGVNRRVGS
jgi:hypothetical protein